MSERPKNWLQTELRRAYLEVTRLARYRERFAEVEVLMEQQARLLTALQIANDDEENPLEAETLERCMALNMHTRNVVRDHEG